METKTILPETATVSIKPLTVWVSEEEKARFLRLAKERGLSMSTFLKQSITAGLTPPDPRTDFKRLTADVRADLSQTINRIAENDALQAQAREQVLADMRDLFNGFLQDLANQQVAAVVGAVRAGQGRPAVPQRDPTPAEAGLPPRAPTLKK